VAEPDASSAWKNSNVVKGCGCATPRGLASAFQRAAPISAALPQSRAVSPLT
jgi:hypothetical protein